MKTINFILINNNFRSKLQVDMPDYLAEPLSTGRFTGGAKRKRHGHGALNHSPKPQSHETDTTGSCCPTVEEIVEPIGGKSKSGKYFLQ